MEFLQALKFILPNESEIHFYLLSLYVLSGPQLSNMLKIIWLQF